MKSNNKTKLYVLVQLIYYLIIILYAVVLIPIMLTKFNIFYSFIFRQIFVTTVFFGFGLLLGLQNLLYHFIVSSPFTYCKDRIKNAIYLLFSYGFSCFVLLVFEVVQNNEGIHLLLTMLSVFVGYTFINSFNLVRPQLSFVEQLYVKG